MKPNNAAASTLLLPTELRDVLMMIGRGLGTVSVYGENHPSVDQVVSKTFDCLQVALKDRDSVSIGSFNGTLAVDDEPVTAREVPIRTLEKRLTSMKVSHLALHAGLSKEELKQLLSALCSQTDAEMKEALSGSGLEHIELEDVKYVILRDGEKKTGAKKKEKDEPAPVEIPPAQVNQIVAFLKGAATDNESMDSIKKALSDPEKLGQMIMEAAAIRQAGVDVQDGESLADIVVGCLRRTYEGLRKEKEFKSVRGKASLAKAMMLLEKNVLDKIHQALGAEHPKVDQQIFDAIREMEEEREFEALTAHYFSQSKKMQKAEGQIVEAIRNASEEKALEQLEASGLPPKDWQRLMVQAGKGSGDDGDTMPGMDMSALAVVLEKLSDLMQMENQTPEEMKAEFEETKSRLKTYADQIEMRIEELEGQIDMGESDEPTVEHHAKHLSREELMKQVSELTLSLIQPLTVINASVEAAQRKDVKKEIRKDLLSLAHISGKRMQSLAKRLMKLVGYPVLEETPKKK